MAAMRLGSKAIAFSSILDPAHRLPATALANAPACAGAGSFTASRKTPA